MSTTAQGLAERGLNGLRALREGRVLRGARGRRAGLLRGARGRRAGLLRGARGLRGAGASSAARALRGARVPSGTRAPSATRVLRVPRALRALPRSLPALSPRLRRRLLLLLCTSLALGAGYQFWLRDSSLVAVERVEVTGLTSADAKRVRASLTTAGKGMTTLNVDRELLDRAVAAYPVVRELEVSADFPHGLRVRVVEHHAAAMAISDSGQIPVAGDGTILRGLPVEGRLPVVDVNGSLGGDRLRDTSALSAAAVAGAAPAALRRRVDEVLTRAEDGLVAELDEGPELIFGGATRLRAKWAAAARVLADPEARGASYIDLRIPGRPAAGGLAAATVTPVAPVGAAPTTVVPPAGAGVAATGVTPNPSAAGVAVDPSGAPVDPSGVPIDPSVAPVDPSTAPLAPPAGTTVPPAGTAAPPVTEAPAAPPAQTTPPPAGTGAEGGATAPGAP